jgi:hypothetical protein
MLFAVRHVQFVNSRASYSGDNQVRISSRTRSTESDHSRDFEQ